jgi:nondiscriminating glutamyl-tRNA synthetase
MPAMKTMTCKTRFAPSPTGYLHLGNVRTALFNALLARREQGSFLLRIEDTDRERSRPEYVAALLEDLRWLGLDWQEGPEIGGPHPPYAQSERAAIYAGYYQRLEERGLVYPCFCSPAELALSRKTQLAAGRPPRYAGTCARLSEAERQARRRRGLQPTLRFRTPPGQLVQFIDLARGPQQFASDDIGDFIIRRADGGPQFFFANAVDDALMGITHLLRGEDHLSNTPRQLLLLEALDLPAPHYGHLALIVGADGGPLSKREGHFSVRELRATGYLPEALLNDLARIGHSYAHDHWMSLAELAEAFTLERLGRAPARYDEAQLLHWQSEAVQCATPGAVMGLAGISGCWRCADNQPGGIYRCSPPEYPLPDRCCILGGAPVWGGVAAERGEPGAGRADRFRVFCPRSGSLCRAWRRLSTVV